jgi:UDP-glucose 4-epimerase
MPTPASIFNVCTEIEISVLDLASAIADISGRRLDLQHRPARPGEIRRSVGSRNLSRAMLGLCEPVKLRDGLRQVLEWLDGVN